MNKLTLKAIAALCLSASAFAQSRTAANVPYVASGAASVAWTSGTYKQGQIVTRNNQICISLNPSNTGDPATDTTDWACSTGGSGGTWGSITGTLTNQTDLANALAAKAASNAATTVNGVPCALGATCTISTGGGAAGYTDAGSTFTSSQVSSCTASNGLQISQGIVVSTGVTIPTTCALKFVPGGELLPASGVTITFAKGAYVQAPDSLQIFGGAGAVTALSQPLSAAWFGAYPDTGSDQTAALTAAVNACGAYGCDVRVQPGVYHTSANIAIPNTAGIIGPPLGNLSAPPVLFLNTSATSTVFSFTGYLQRLQNLSVGRSVVPSSTAIGIDCVNDSQYLIRNVWVTDSAKDIHYNGCPSGYQGTYNVSAAWGQNGVSGYPNGFNAVGYDLDSDNGVAENSIILSQVGSGDQPNGVNVTQVSIHGTAVNDVNIDKWNGGATNHGLVINYTGSGAADSSFDLHISHATWDVCLVDCVSITNMPSNGSVVINDLYASGASASATVKINNSYNVNIQGAEIANGGSGGGGLNVTGGGNNIFQGLQFVMVNGGNYMLLSGTSGNNLSNITFTGQGADGNSFLALANGATRNNGTNITSLGAETYGLYFSANSVQNKIVNWSFPGVANTLNDLSNGQNTTSLGNPLAGNYACPSGDYLTAIAFSGSSATLTCSNGTTTTTTTTTPAAEPTYSSVTLLADYDATKITGVTSGSGLAAWADVSGNSNTLSATAAQPTYQATGFNGVHPGVVFNYNPGNIMTANFLPSSGVVTICAALSNPVQYSNYANFVDVAGFGSQLRDGFTADTPGVMKAYDGAVFLGQNGTGYGYAGAGVVVCYINNGANSGLYNYAGGIVNAMGNLNGGLSTPTGNFFVGGYSGDQGGDYLGGTIGRLLIFQGAASDTDARAIISNLVSQFSL